MPVRILSSIFIVSRPANCFLQLENNPGATPVSLVNEPAPTRSRISLRTLKNRRPTSSRGPPRRRLFSDMNHLYPNPYVSSVATACRPGIDEFSIIPLQTEIPLAEPASAFIFRPFAFVC